MQKFTLHTATEKHEVFAPSGWHELTLQQLIKLETEWRPKPNVLTAFSILTGLNIEIAENLKDKNIESNVWHVVKFLNTSPDWVNMKPPKHILIGLKAHRVPLKIGDFMLGQKIMLLQAVESFEKLIENIPIAIATIMQPYIDKMINKGVLKYSGERVETIAETLNKSNGLECYALAMFFFAKWTNIQAIGRNDSKKYQRSIPQMENFCKKWLTANA